MSGPARASHAPARDTIVAVASPPGPAARGILRLSGDRARALVEGRLVGPWPGGRGAHAVRLRDARGEQPALLLWMPGPASYTREDVVELHLAGNPHLLAAALEALLADGARRAGPGEFTRRAFEHGRLDLTRAEGVLELVSARSEDERRAAASLLAGGLARRVEGLRDELDQVRALCEASLDFDESDTGHVPTEELARGLEAAAGRLAEAQAWEAARPARAGLATVALVGAPNAGKSSLFNALARPGAVPALVSELAGTTRDPLRVEVELDGSLAAELFDLAGLAAAGGRDVLDAAAQTRARELAARADLVVWAVRADRTDLDGLAAERAGLADCPPRLGLWTQTDRAEVPALPPPQVRALDPGLPWLPTALGASAESGTDPADPRLTPLRAALAALLAERPAAGGLSRELAEVHRTQLALASGAVEAAREGLALGLELDLVAGELRRAVDALDALTGHTSPEDLLDRIFSRFCIGK